MNQSDTASTLAGLGGGGPNAQPHVTQPSQERWLAAWPSQCCMPAWQSPRSRTRRSPPGAAHRSTYRHGTGHVFIHNVHLLRRLGHLQQLGCNLLLCGQHNPVWGQHPDRGAGVANRLHRVLYLVEPPLRRKDGCPRVIAPPRLYATRQTGEEEHSQHRDASQGVWGQRAADTSRPRQTKGQQMRASVGRPARALQTDSGCGDYGGQAIAEHTARSRRRARPLLQTAKMAGRIVAALATGEQFTGVP